MGLLAFALIPFAAIAKSTTASNLIGRTPQEIHARFAGVIWTNLSTPHAARRLRGFTDFEMEKLAATYINASHGGPPLQGLIKLRAPAQALRYQQAVDAAIAKHWVMPTPIVVTPPPSVPIIVPRPVRPIGGLPGRGFEPIERPVRPIVVPRGVAARNKGPSPPLPNVGMTFDEIYLEFRTAQLGSMGMEAALFETARYAGGELGLAATIGWTAGEVLSYGMKNYCEACDNAVGAVADALWNQVPASAAAPLMLVQTGYGIGDFGVADDLVQGAGFTGPPDPTYVGTMEGPIQTGSGFGLNDGFGFDMGSPGDGGGGGHKKRPAH